MDSQATEWISFLVLLEGVEYKFRSQQEVQDFVHQKGKPDCRYPVRLVIDTFSHPYEERVQRIKEKRGEI